MSRLLKEIEELEDKAYLYYELLYAVERKFPDETRHQTALRYIQEAENQPISMPSQDKVTHWMPLPPPPETTEDKEK